MNEETTVKAKEQIKEVTVILARDVVVECPYCGEKNDGWFGNPAGAEEKCDFCGKTFRVSKFADIEFDY